MRESQALRSLNALSNFLRSSFHYFDEGPTVSPSVTQNAFGLMLRRCVFPPRDDLIVLLSSNVGIVDRFRSTVDQGKLVFDLSPLLSESLMLRLPGVNRLRPRVPISQQFGTSLQFKHVIPSSRDGRDKAGTTESSMVINTNAIQTQFVADVTLGSLPTKEGDEFTLSFAYRRTDSLEWILHLPRIRSRVDRVIEVMEIPDFPYGLRYHGPETVLQMEVN